MTRSEAMSALLANRSLIAVGPASSRVTRTRQVFLAGIFRTPQFQSPLLPRATLKHIASAAHSRGTPGRMDY